eukprot:m.138963 g.138963  ORF g.138963 m.138963 type:complete len:80 (+) comp30026_c2_seq1:823-1062(+)
MGNAMASTTISSMEEDQTRFVITLRWLSVMWEQNHNIKPKLPKQTHTIQPKLRKQTHNPKLNQSERKTNTDHKNKKGTM